ncbi:hypothetical protein Ndes2526B_g01737 [Nannochloris sp. 'desiccata']|nr:hypothetical protein NADE_002502 [Chlorella desiccata (nom. nud.)]
MSAQEMPQGEGGEQITAKSLSVHANEYKPTSTPVPSAKSNSVKPVKTRDPFETLDYVPFTPSQGICTPSPSNVAAMWMARRSFSDLTSDGSSLSSMASSEYGAGHPIFVPAAAIYPVYAPMPYSPGAPHPMFATSIPSPHHHHHGSWSPAGGPPPEAAAFFAAPSPIASGAYVGSPALGRLTPGRRIFSQYLVQEGYGSESSNSPQNSSSFEGSTGPPSGQKSDKSSSQRSVSPGALEAAVSWCADKGLTTKEPPHAVIELASLALVYGINLEAAADFAAAAPTTGPSTTSSPVKQRSRQQQEKSTSANDNNYNNIRLNARQRRTLRRALDRALAALENGEEEEGATDIDSSAADPQQHHLKNNQQQVAYKTPIKTHNYTYNNASEENEYLQMTPSGATTNNNNNGNNDGVLSMAFGSPAFVQPQPHHPQNWAQNGAISMPMHMQMGFHAVAAAAAENAMAQISMAQQHHVHAAAAAAQAAGYMGPMPMSPHQHHHMMAIAGPAMPAVYHQDQQQMQQQHSMGNVAARGRINRSSRFAPKMTTK